MSWYFFLTIDHPKNNIRWQLLINFWSRPRDQYLILLTTVTMKKSTSATGRKGRRGLENYDYLGYCWNGRESKTITDFLSSSPSYNIPVPPQIRLNNTQQIWFSRAPTHRRQDHKYNTEIQKYRTIQSRKYDIPVAWGRRGDNHKHIRAFPLTVSAWLASIVSSPRRKLRCFWETEFL